MKPAKFFPHLPVASDKPNIETSAAENDISLGHASGAINRRHFLGGVAGTALLSA